MAEEVSPSIRLIRDHLISAKTNINQLAKEVNVSQSGLFRFMNGERKTVTPMARQVLMYIDNLHKQHGAATGNMLGDPIDAALVPIADAIRARGPLSARSLSLLAAIISAVVPMLESSVGSSQ